MLNPFRRESQVRSFAVDSARLGPLARHSAGVHAVPVASIVGSVGRDHELRPNFMPILKPHGDFRFARILEAMESGTPLPAIVAYKLGGRYYVVDGNHRVAAARRSGLVEIDAEVTEFQPVSRPMPAGALA